MAVTLGHDVAVDLGRQRARIDGAGLGAQAHGAAQVRVGVALLDLAVVVLPLGDQGDDRLVGFRIELGRVRVRQAGHIAGVLDQRDLHAQADAEVRDLVFAGVARGHDLAFHAALAKAPRHQDGVVLGQVLAAAGLDFFRVQVLDVDPALGMDAGVAQRLGQRFIRFDQVDVLADHADGDLVFWILERVNQLGPHRQVGLRRFEAQGFEDDVVQALVAQHLRHLVDGVHVPHRDHGLLFDVGEQRDLGALVVRDAAVGAAQQRVRRDADLAQLLHAVLGRLGLEFAGRCDVRHQGQVHESGALAARAQRQLARGFQERQRLDVAHGAADLDQRDVDAFGAAADVVLDLVGDVRDDLHGLAEVFAATLLADHRFIDLAGGEVVHLLHAGADEALVVAEVEVGLGAIIGDEHFAVLGRAHGARVDVDVGIELEQGDFEAAALEDRGEGGGRDPFAQGRHDAASDEYEFGHCADGAEWHAREIEIIP